MEKDRISMSQRERDVLKVMALVLNGKRSQAEAARRIGRSERQVRRLLKRLQANGDAGVIHRLRGRLSNNRIEDSVRQRAIKRCRTSYADFGPTLAAEKLLEDDQIHLSVETLRGWMLAEGLWQRKRHRDKHRQHRTRRACFGEMVQADASEHDWLDGRGPMLTLVGMIDDATDRVVLRFHESETTCAYMDVLGRWIRKFGRPVSWYSNRHSLFRAEEMVSGYDEKQSVPTQFSRALEELGIELILARSPQAKGRVERLWGTGQDRLVKELRLAKARTLEEANAVLETTFVRWFNRRCTNKPASANDAHREIGELDLHAVLSIQEKRAVANDYTIRFENQMYQLLPPTLPGERGGTVIVENRLDETMKVRFKGTYLSFRRIAAASEQERKSLGALPPNPRSLTHGLIPVIEEKDPAARATGSITVHQADGRSGRTPAEPCPPASGSCGSSKESWRPASGHPWRRSGIGQTGHFNFAETPDVSTLV
jgi:DNA-binding Lrp family transcriptional regulator